jgi:hypothetical protein
MWLPRFRLLSVAAVLVVAMTLLVSRGVADALLMILIVAVLAGQYMLRRYARAELLYRPLAERQRQRQPDDRPARAAS